MNVCEFSNVTKRYGDRVILDRCHHARLWADHAVRGGA